MATEDGVGGRSPGDGQQELASVGLVDEPVGREAAEHLRARLVADPEPAGDLGRGHPRAVAGHDPEGQQVLPGGAGEIVLVRAFRTLRHAPMVRRGRGPMSPVELRVPSFVPGSGSRPSSGGPGDAPDEPGGRGTEPGRRGEGVTAVRHVDGQVRLGCGCREARKALLRTPRSPAGGRRRAAAPTDSPAPSAAEAAGRVAGGTSPARGAAVVLARVSSAAALSVAVGSVAVPRSADPVGSATAAGSAAAAARAACSALAASRRPRAWYSGPCLRGSANSFGLSVQYVPDEPPYQLAPSHSGSNGSRSAPS